MKLAVFISVLLATSAFSQSSTTRGTRIGQVQTAYFDDVPQAVANAVEISNRFREILHAAPPGVPQPTITPIPAGQSPRAEFETWVEQPSRDYAESVVTGNTGIERDARKVSIHRFVRDNFRQTYLTDTVTLENIPATQTVRVSFSDAIIPIPVPQILRNGETIALTLESDARTERRIVDYIRVGRGSMKPRQEAAREVYAEDAKLTITESRLRINGLEQPAGSLPPILSAPIVLVDIPEQGRFVLSFKPRATEGFERAGEVSGTSMVFSFAANTFRIDSADRIATGSGTYNIYARKEATK